MKNKVLTYALLAVVIGVWGFIIRQVFVATQDDDSPSITTKPQQLTEMDLSYYRIKNDLPLALNYRDPIWSDEKVTQVVEEEIMDDLDMSPLPPQAFLPPLPAETAIDYLGFITNEKTGKKVAIVAIDGQQHMIAPQEQRQGVRVSKILEDQIIVIHEGKTKTIFK